MILTEEQSQFHGEIITYFTNAGGKIKYTYAKKNELYTYLTPYIKISSKEYIDLNVKAKK